MESQGVWHTFALAVSQIAGLPVVSSVRGGENAESGRKLRGYRKFIGGVRKTSYLLMR
jgi:hypothetical protein